MQLRSFASLIPLSQMFRFKKKDCGENYDLWHRASKDHAKEKCDRRKSWWGCQYNISILQNALKLAELLQSLSNAYRFEFDQESREFRHFRSRIICILIRRQWDDFVVRSLDVFINHWLNHVIYGQPRLVAYRHRDTDPLYLFRISILRIETKYKTKDSLMSIASIGIIWYTNHWILNYNNIKIWWEKSKKLSTQLSKNYLIKSKICDTWLDYI